MVKSLTYLLTGHFLVTCFVYSYTNLSPPSLKAIPDPGSDFDIESGSLLSPILQPRVPGTPGSTAVLEHFVSFFRKELPTWNLTYQNSTAKTPISGSGETPFINLIASRDPPGTNPGEIGYLTLVAHYDSLIKPEGFIGAIDSAAPCAMLMHVARSLEPVLLKKWEGKGQEGAKTEDFDEDLEGHKGVKIIFLDGEEAFDVWSDEDSIYGAKALAEDMENTVHPALSTFQNALEGISLFVLLDLLGSKSPRVPSYFKTTHWAYQHLKEVADRLKDAGAAIKNDVGGWFPDFEKNDRAGWMGGMIGDDHVPFMARGVEVLHLIPSPFPSVWHKIEDDGEHLDIATCKDWAVLMTAFAAEWMDLEGHFGTSKERSMKDEL